MKVTLPARGATGTEPVALGKAAGTTSGLRLSATPPPSLGNNTKAGIPAMTTASKAAGTRTNTKLVRATRSRANIADRNINNGNVPMPAGTTAFTMGGKIAAGMNNPSNSLSNLMGLKMGKPR